MNQSWFCNHGIADQIGTSNRIFFAKQNQATHKLSCIIRLRTYHLTDGNVANVNQFQIIKKNSRKTWNSYHNLKYDGFILIS